MISWENPRKNKNQTTLCNTQLRVTWGRFLILIFTLLWPQSFCFFHFVRITEITQITLRSALGIPHSFLLSLSISNPFLSLYFSHFQVISALRFASALAPVNEEKEGEKEKPRIRKLSSHTVRALCPNSEKMREKRKERERKRYGQNWFKKKYLERLREWRILPFWEYGTLPRLTFCLRTFSVILKRITENNVSHLFEKQHMPFRI